jgi:hypothetical protein
VGEGYRKERILKRCLWYPSPGPLPRATLSLQERELPKYIFQLGQHSLSKESSGIAERDPTSREGGWFQRDHFYGWSIGNHPSRGLDFVSTMLPSLLSRAVGTLKFKRTHYPENRKAHERSSLTCLIELISAKLEELMRIWCFVLMLAVVVPAAAHHPFSQYYDGSKLETLTGVVSEIRIINPHVVLIVDVTAPASRKGRWGFEGNPPNALLRNGVDLKKKLLPGTQITISGWAAKDPKARVFSGREITFGDKSTMIFGPTPEGGDQWRCDGVGPCPFKYPEVPAP